MAGMEDWALQPTRRCHPEIGKDIPLRAIGPWALFSESSFADGTQGGSAAKLNGAIIRYLPTISVYHFRFC